MNYLTQAPIMKTADCDKKNLVFAVDIISAVEFESRGDYLATADHGGRVALFERTNGKDVTALTHSIDPFPFCSRFPLGFNLLVKCLSLESVPPQGAEGCIPMLMTTTLILYQLIGVTVICSDCETFLSADDLRINMWNLEVGNQCFNIIDLKPLDMEDLVVYKIVKLMDLDPFSQR
ncbi:hypothetical protein BHE74_00030237 [Ensete ventricosum]|nr:hypothetical protein BHE74_00030237 [Ensete ventricosum]RZR93013.1 hypothetical protein BHM03_00021406 [Ensete ventricosum]